MEHDMSNAKLPPGKNGMSIYILVDILDYFATTVEFHVCIHNLILIKDVIKKQTYFYEYSIFGMKY
jgi:hypothetical protein